MKWGKSEAHPKEDGGIELLRRKEIYPKGSEIAMKYGFFIILLNMAFGLLPITIRGNKMKYMRCSLAQLYALVFGLIMCFLSFVFLPVVFRMEMAGDTISETSMVIMVIVRVLHVGGFTLLLIRGHWVAKRMDKVWTCVGKLVQVSSLDAYGKLYELLRKLAYFSWKSLIIYFLAMASHSVLSYTHRSNMVLRFLFMRNGVSYADFIMENATSFPFIQIGYVIWDLCNMSHVFVSMFLGFLVTTITVSLECVNIQLKEVVDVLCRKGTLSNFGGNRFTARDEFLLDSLERTRKCYHLSEWLTTYCSSLWGISIIIEVIILIGNMLGNLYYFLGEYQKSWSHNMNLLTNSTFEGADDVVKQFNYTWTWTSYLIAGFCHFYFFYQLCDASSKLKTEVRLFSF